MGWKKTMLVGSITQPHQFEEARRLADLVELRLDSFDIEERPPGPVIFTLRRKEGQGEGERLALIEKYLALKPDYCDLETDTDPLFIERMAKKFPEVKLIGSYHNFQEMPAGLEGILARMKNPHFAIYKIAVTPHSTSELLHFLRFAKGVKVPLSAIAMGEYGRPSRVLGPVIGNALDYAGVEDDPLLHRYSLKRLLEVFHYRKLNRETKIYALIGDPVAESPGDLFHNPRFRHNGVYVKMVVKAEEASTCFRLMKEFPFAGLSVTMPLKEVLFSLVDELTEEAKAIGAINTVAFSNGKAFGANTDGPGALIALERKGKVAGKRVAILGAGGTARAIAFEAKRRGALVSVYNRTRERARVLAKELGCEGFGLDELSEYDVLVNTIPHFDQIPPILPEAVVMDVVYTPREIPLFKGVLSVYGEEMFVEQALLQQEIWFTKK